LTSRDVERDGILLERVLKEEQSGLVSRAINAKDAKEKTLESAKRFFFASFAMHFASFAFTSPFLTRPEKSNKAILRLNV
jgi:hypothetical protein